MKLERIIEGYGLTKKQANIYMACLELGPASVQKIAQKAGLPRSSVYEMLDFLKKKGFVSSFLKRKTKYFNPEDPKQLVELARSNLEQFERLLPQFNALYASKKDKPTTRFYEGREGMRLILEEILLEAKEVLGFVSADDLFEQLGDYFYDFVEKRVKNKIPARVIFCKDTKKSRERQNLGKIQLRTSKILSGQHEHHGALFIWKNKIAMLSFLEDFVAVVVESKEVAQMQRAMFEYLWDLAD